MHPKLDQALFLGAADAVQPPTGRWCRNAATCSGAGPTAIKPLRAASREAIAATDHVGPTPIATGSPYSAIARARIISPSSAGSRSKNRMLPDTSATRTEGGTVCTTGVTSVTRPWSSP